MLAVRLHKTKNPKLNKGCYLIPIVSWVTGNIQIKEWINILNTDNRGRPNNCIRYITLVKIPDSHPIAFFKDLWADQLPPINEEDIIFVNNGIKFTPLRNIAVDKKAELKEWYNTRAFFPPPTKEKLIQWLMIFPTLKHEKQEYLLTKARDYGGPSYGFPEIILGMKLPQSCIKWTKDVRLLYSRRKKKEESI